MNTLYYGDNLEVLRRYLPDESVDLIYLDPPFNSNATYNVLFAERDGSRSAAQIQAFGDTWQWDQAAAATYQETVESGGKVSQALQAFRILLGPSNMLAYLVMMAPRLVELHRVLKPTGSLYLHCDPNASHYLKVVLDAVFGPTQFLNETVWERFNFHADADRWGRLHDVLLFYAKDHSKMEFHTQRRAYDEAYIKSHFKPDENKRIFRFDNVLAAGQGPARVFFGKFMEPPVGTHWRFSQKNIDKMISEGRIVLTSTGKPTVKRYLDEMPGHAIGDVWTDIPEINSQAKERLGYPTQKPLALLDRILQASSNPGDVILDPFCGCGTAIASAQKLGRQWIGIDITHLAINLIKHRLLDAFGDQAHYQVIGEPTTIEDATDLAACDPYQFQWWALGLVGARPVEGKKGADQGIDGRLYFHDDQKGTTRQIIFQVKAGHTNASHVRDLEGVLNREQAQIGILITLQDPTQPMRSEAATAGYYESPWGKHPRLQLLTIADLLSGQKIDMPPIKQTNITFKKAPKQPGKQGKQISLLEDDN